MTYTFKTKATLAASAGLFLSTATAAFAHHSFAMYDNSRSLELNGLVREFKWSNPHGAIYLTVMERGKPVEYNVELSSPNVMSRQGWNRRTIQAGERLRVTIHPLRDGSKGGSFMRAVKANGVVLGPTAPP